MDIRKPDEAKREKLIADHCNEYNYEIDEALYQSMQDIILEQKRNEDYENELKNNFTKILSERSEIFKGLLFHMKRIACFDQNVKEIYEIIEPIIDAYCNQIIENCTIDQKTHERIFKTLSTIRTNKKSLKLLSMIINV